jgi:hypothetical protein
MPRAFSEAGPDSTHFKVRELMPHDSILRLERLNHGRTGKNDHRRFRDQAKTGSGRPIGELTLLDPERTSAASKQAVLEIWFRPYQSTRLS